MFCFAFLVVVRFLSPPPAVSPSFLPLFAAESETDRCLYRYVVGLPFAAQVFNDTTGQYATIPNDASEGDTCQGYANMGTCRPDGCPNYAIPMNISERVEQHFWLLAGSADAVEAREQVQAQVLNNPPLLFYGLPSAGAPTTVAPLGHGRALPESVHLLNLGVRVNTSGAPNLNDAHTDTDTDTPTTLVLRLQNVADAAAALDLSAVGLCGLLGDDAVLEERSLSTIWPLSGTGALSRWDWDTQTVERDDDSVDLNRLNRSPEYSSTNSSTSTSTTRRATSHRGGVKTHAAAHRQCDSTTLHLHKHDLRTYYVN